MEKPYSIKVEEFKENIVSAVNGCELPAQQIVPIISELLRTVNEKANAQLEQDRIAWKKHLTIEEGRKCEKELVKDELKK